MVVLYKEMNTGLKKIIGIASLVFLLAFGLRLPGLGSFMTADEENWMIRSGEFWHNLFLNNDPGGTFRTGHPGVITMWLSGAGIFAQEIRVGFHIDQSNLGVFRFAATLPIALAISLLIAVAAYQGIRLFGYVPGFWMGVLLASEPYLVGMSQVVHLDMLLGLFMLNGFLTLLRYLEQGKKISQLVLVGVFTAWALLNKFLPALWLLPMYVVTVYFSSSGSFWRKMEHVLRSGLFVAGVALLVFFFSWPALFVMKNTADYIQRDAVNVATQEHISTEETEDPIEPVTFYARSALARLTPFVLIAFMSIVIAGAIKWKQDKKIPSVYWLILFGLSFLVFVTLPAKKADRYALPAFIMIASVAGLGVGYAYTLLRHRTRENVLVSFSIGAFVVVLLSAQALLQTPYAIAYNNPLFMIRPYPQQGWGEGLDEAAAYLNANPFIDNLYVASWYPSVFGTYFKGKTLSLSARDDNRIGYIVTYRNMLGRAGDDIATNVLDEFANRTPEHVIYVAGAPYVWIYNVMQPKYFERHIDELVAGVAVGQRVPIETETFSAIDLGMVTYSSRNNTEDLIFHIKDSFDAKEDIRTVIVNAKNIEDESWHRFAFEPIEQAKGKVFYLLLESPASSAGNAVSVRYTNKDAKPGEMFWRRSALKDGQKNSDFVNPSSDLAYRLP